MTFDRSLENNWPINESLLTFLERLAAGGFLKNNRQWIICYRWPRDPRFLQIIRSMNKLEKVNLEYNLTLTEDLPQLFQLCPTLTELRIRSLEINRVERERFKEMNEELKNELRSGFKRLRLLDLWEIDSCPEIEEILTQVQRRQIKKKQTILKFSNFN